VSLTRRFLLATGILYVLLGVAYLVAPVRMAALADLALPTAKAVIEIRGFYGGQLVGIGAFILLGAWRSSYASPALLLIALSLGGTAVGRLVGISSAGTLPPIIVGVLAIEITASVVALFLLIRGADTPAA